MKNKKVLHSASISIGVHLLAAALLFSQVLQLKPAFLTRIGKSSLLLEEESRLVARRNRALAEVFAHFSLQALRPHFETVPRPSSTATFSPTDLTVEELETVFAEEKVLRQTIPYLLPPLPRKIVTLTPPTGYSIALSSSSASLTLPISYSSAVEEPSTPSPLLFPPRSASPPTTFTSPAPRLDPATPPFKHPSYALQNFRPTIITPTRPSLSPQDYGLPALYFKEWGDLFDTDVKILPHEEKGFIFSIALIPKRDLSEYRLKQNFLFVIDRSNSVDKNQYQGFKRAVTRALAALREGDYFNILLLDSSLTPFNDKPLPFNKANHALATQFLDKQTHGHRGAAADIYSTLTKIVPLADASDEATTAILISDGDSTLKTALQRKKINQWVEANKGRVTLYTATAGHGNNLSALKMVGLASRGSLLYSDTHAAFPRKLAKLVMDLRCPIGKEMAVSLNTPEAHIFPPSFRLPYLFADHPFVLIGTCEKLADFTLTLEGKSKTHDLIIKKVISLSKAKPASRLLLKQWATEKANHLLDQYLREGEVSFLEKARTSLGYDSQNTRR